MSPMSRDFGGLNSGESSYAFVSAHFSGSGSCQRSSCSRIFDEIHHGVPEC
ncbi:hypothetical protein RSSM_05080 [Rhodopirellula sallentina SM41]|uniref:Uncharacterized protein n=1 Tax=Rhodopirellula sallentina SM41 TaxID=1263870 RepID=M5TWQ0_9BACT|nr:hypothetical protein RSSM_05080 [Rhodopirellula sallentina SM41]